MKRISAALILALLAAVPAVAAPGDNQISIAASAQNVVFGKTVTVAGQLTGPGSAGEQVTLQADPVGGGSAFDDVATATTNATGNYSFTVTPTVNVNYRVRAKTSPPTESATVLVGVAPKLSLAVSDSTPLDGQRVRFAGSVKPAHDGSAVQLQRRTSSGYKTVATVTLLDAGDRKSVWSKKVTIARSGTYRAVLPAHEDHKTGKSRRITLQVG